MSLSIRSHYLFDLQLVTTPAEIADNRTILVARPNANRDRVARSYVQPIVGKRRRDSVAPPPPDRPRANVTPINDVSPNRRRGQGELIQTKGAARTSPSDPRTFPILAIERDPDHRRRIRKGSTRILPGASRVGVADPRTKPALLVRDADHRRRLRKERITLLRGAAKISSTDPRSRPTLTPIRDLDQKRRVGKGDLIRTNGSARTSPSDPRTFPVTIERDPDHRRRYRYGDVIRTMGGARTSASDARTWPVQFERDPDPSRRRGKGALVWSKGGRIEDPPRSKIGTMVLVGPRITRAGSVRFLRTPPIFTDPPKQSPIMLLAPPHRLHGGWISFLKGGRIEDPPEVFPPGPTFTAQARPVVVAAQARDISHGSESGTRSTTITPGRPTDTSVVVPDRGVVSKPRIIR